MNDLVLGARSARNSAYAPYSEYPVGAAIETMDGTVFTGSNIEFANFSNTLHAEEMALGSAVLADYRSFAKIAVSTEDGAPPCGLCRQSLAEFDDGSLIVLADDGASVAEFTLNELLPNAFSLE